VTTPPVTFELHSGPSVYMCGHVEFLLQRVGRPGQLSFLGWSDQAEELVTWLNALRFDDDDDDERLAFTMTTARRCGHWEFWLYCPYRPGHVTFYTNSSESAARFCQRLGDILGD
jgi:hypothetical protein